jgi:hypothetical protein
MVVKVTTVEHHETTSEESEGSEGMGRDEIGEQQDTEESTEKEEEEGEPEGSKRGSE